MRFINTNPCRSTNPRLATIPSESILAHNYSFVHFHARTAALVICAWGKSADPKLAKGVEEVLRASVPGGNLYTLGLTKDGIPKHPLYLDGLTRPQLWTPER